MCRRCKDRTSGQTTRMCCRTRSRQVPRGLTTKPCGNSITIQKCLCNKPVRPWISFGRVATEAGFTANYKVGKTEMSVPLRGRNSRRVHTALPVLEGTQLLVFGQGPHVKSATTVTECKNLGFLADSAGGDQWCGRLVRVG